jgi:hypothetical protein
VHIQTLRLADVCTPLSSEVEDLLLRYLPDGLIDCFDVRRDIGNVLDRAIMRDNHVLHVIIPKAEIDKFAEKPRTNDLKFSSKNTACVNIAVSLNEFHFLDGR